MVKNLQSLTSSPDKFIIVNFTNRPFLTLDMRIHCVIIVTIPRKVITDLGR